MQQIAHRSGPLRQKNKQHKTRHRSKRSLVASGIKVKRTVAGTANRSKRVNGRKNRRAERKQKRLNKQDSLRVHRKFTIAADVPVLAALITVGVRANSISIIDQARSFGAVDHSITSTTLNVILRFPDSKQKVKLICPNINDPFQCMDAVKASECVIFACHVIDIEMEDMNQSVIEMMIHCCVQKRFVLLQGLEELPAGSRRTQALSSATRFFKSMFGDCKVFSMGRKKDFESLLQFIGSSKPVIVPSRTGRAFLASDNFELTSEREFTLQGIVRGNQLNLNRLLYIPGIGPCKIRSARIIKGLGGDSGSTVLPDGCVDLPDYRPPIPEEAASGSLSGDEDGDSLEMRNDYASWVEDFSEDSGDCSETSSTSIDDCDMREGNQLLETMRSTENQQVDDPKYNPDDRSSTSKRRVTFAEDVEFNNSDDETLVDLHLEEGRDMSYLRKARSTLKDYHDIAHFPAADEENSLPLEYSELSQFEDYRNAVRFIIKTESEQNDGHQIEIGTVVALSLIAGNNLNLDRIADSFICGYSLYPHEEKMTLCNILLNRSIASVQMVKSYQNIVFVAGIRRFSASALFSEVKTGNKFKCHEQFPPGSTLIASVYAPIMMLPCPVLAFTKYLDGSMHLFASGHLVSCDVRRVNLERIVLRGKPYRIGGRKAVVKGMFSNPVDVEYFKDMRISSKSGRKGKIVGSLGTKGRMKCLFDRALKSHDMVLMRLYKRVFPKWDFTDSIELCLNFV